MLSLLWTLIFGLVVGALAKLVMPGKDPGGILVTMGLGILGSFLGKYAGIYLLGRGEDYQAGWIMSILGAVIVLLIYRLIIGRRSTAV